MATIDDFLKLDIRVGKIISAEDFPEARKPAYKLTVDFGTEIGIKKSSAQITQNYTKEELVGMTILAVVNFPPRQVGPFASEILILGVHDKDENVVLVTSHSEVPLGGKLY